MKKLNKLYAILAILIIVYIGINVGANGLNILNSEPASIDSNDSDMVAIGDNGFPDLENFTSKKISNTALSLTDSNKHMTINVSEIDNSKNVSEIASSAFSSGGFTSNQTIDQNGVPVYLLYNEGSESYSSDIYFNKNNQNYMISGSGISYENSDYFIDHCKQIIDGLDSNGDSSKGISRW